jgi:putative transcriptional regulator
MIKCNLSRILGERKMHITELKRQSGVSYTTLSSLYHEKTSLISFNTIDAICRALGVQVGDLFEYVEESIPKKGKKIKEGRK